MKRFCSRMQLLNGLVKDVTFSTITAADLPVVVIPPITEGMQLLSDVTTQNVSTAQHGYAPKLPNDATKYLDGTGHYTVPAGGGGGGGGSSFTLTPPVDGDFSWVNQGGSSTATVTTDFGDAVVLSVPASGSKNNRLRVMNAPVGAFTVTAYFKILADPSDFWNAGLTFYDSGSGKQASFQVSQVGTPVLGSSTFNSVTSFNADYRSVGLNLFPHGMEFLLRIADDTTNRICSWSVDGVNFQTFHSVGRTNFMTADQIGFWANSQNSVSMKMILLSWLVA